tara:strand:- start:27944 stop:28129 length:186 start_codon:yes stop_codon:yes gene_type:complete
LAGRHVLVEKKDVDDLEFVFAAGDATSRDLANVPSQNRDADGRKTDRLFSPMLACLENTKV